MHMTQQVGRRRPRFLWPNNRGAILGTALVLLAILTLLGSMAIMTAVTDNDIAGNLKTRIQTFNDAEAGVHYTIASVAPAIAAGQLKLDGTLPSETYTVEAPPYFAFNPCGLPTTFTQVGASRRYQFEVTSQATRHDGKSSTTLQVAMQREPLLLYGLFGDEGVNFPTVREVYSYDSRKLKDKKDDKDKDPKPSKTGEAHVATNGVFAVGALASPSLVLIDGNVALGDNGDTPTPTEGSISVTGTLTVNGQAGEDIPRVNPDPLGAASGALATKFVTYSTANNNASKGIVSNTIHLTEGEELTLTAGIYYLESVILEPGSTLHIDTTAGDVQIFLTGEFNVQGSPDPTNNPKMTFDGHPPQFRIFSNANEPIVFNHDGPFKGMIYAPFAHVHMNNNPESFIDDATYAYGLIWAKNISMKADIMGQFYIDKAAQDVFLSDTVSLVSWREIRK